MEITYQDLQEIFVGKGYAFFDNGSYNVNLFGIRSGDLRVDEFNDIIGVAYRDDFGNPKLELFRATTKPGLYYLKNKLGNIDGTAILIPGQYRGCWTLGFHRGYKALVQKGLGIFKVWRDSDSDSGLDTGGEVFDNVTGLNLHTTSFNNEVDRVGRYSAGCQVVQDDMDLGILISILTKSANIYGDSFSYTLLEENDFNET